VELFEAFSSSTVAVARLCVNRTSIGSVFRRPLNERIDVRVKNDKELHGFCDCSRVLDLCAALAEMLTYEW